MIIIGIFDKLFGKFTNKTNQYTNLSITNGNSTSFRSTTTDLYELAVTRSCINAIATNAAKLSAVHVVRDPEGVVIDTVGNKATKYTISVRPNMTMSAYDFYYKLITQLYNKNNAFAMIQRSAKGIIGLYPISYSTVEALEYQGEIFMKFNLNSAKTLTVPYADLIHLRRFFYDQDIFGEDNSALNSTLEVIETTNEGLSEATKSSAILRGILKFTTMLKPEDMKKQRDDFITDYLDITNNGGVAATDGKMDYTPLESKPVMIDSQQIQAIRDQVYMYFNISDGIVMNDYSEDEWNAFYESHMEPLAIQMSQEFTYKFYSKNSMTRGNEIMFESNRIAYASNKTKIAFIKEIGILGGMTLNEIREVFNLKPVEDGDQRVQMNVSNVDNQDPDPDPDTDPDKKQKGGKKNVKE